MTIRRSVLGILVLVAGVPAFADPPKPDPLATAERIDRHIADGWKSNGSIPAPVADDAEYLRRVYLDLGGRIPRVRELREFLADARPNKRRLVVRQLLESAGYVNHFSTVYRREWLPQSATNPQLQFFGPVFENWLREQLRTNARYDQIVRDIVTVDPASGYSRATNSGVVLPSAFLLVNENRPENLAASISRMFLGVKIECAQCHNHPFETWTRQQFWEFTAFFAGMQPIDEPRIGRAPTEAVEVRTIAIPDTDRKASAKFLDGQTPQLKQGVSSRVALVEWMTHKDNPYFARNAVNRMWAHLFGTGLIDPVDEPSETNPPSHPELLAELSRAFIDSGFDLKFLIESIVLTKAYQLSSAGGSNTSVSDRTFSRMKVRGLTAEQLFDSLSLATGFREVAPANQRGYGNAGQVRAEFLSRFATTERLSDVQTSILQALTLMNGKLVSDLTSVERSETLAAVIDAPFLSTAEKIETLYLATVSRRPTEAESRRFTAYVDGGGPSRNRDKALADVFWALLNSSEFGFNH